MMFLKENKQCILHIMILKGSFLYVIGIYIFKRDGDTQM